MTDTSLKQVVTMLAKDDGITIFTATGEILNLKTAGPYDVHAISAYLKPLLTGTDAVEIDMSNYLANAVNIDPALLEANGIVVVQIINGVEVEGVFYPKKTSVEVMAQVDGVEEKVIIPNIEHLEGHMNRAAAEQSTSVANFLKRIAPVIAKRKHSGEDLMQFIKLSDLPLTEDGRIIAYKRVNKHKDGKGYFVDVHSGQIKQRVGSRVTMPVDMVDPSRHQSCSTGLHVANFRYLSSFSGTDTIIVLVSPENFIAVPHGENSKARVCSYDIIGTMPQTAHDKVNTGNHITGEISLQELISRAVQGDVIEPFEEVFVADKNVVEVKPLATTGVKPAKAVTTAPKPSGKSLLEDKQKPKFIPNTSSVLDATKVTVIPPEVLTVFAAVKAETPKAEIARNTDTSTRTIGRWMEKYNYSNWVKGGPVHSDPLKAVADQGLDANNAAPVVKFVIPTEGSLAEQARVYFAAGQLVLLREFKKAKKKSWTALGFNATEIGQIE